MFPDCSMSMGWKHILWYMLLIFTYNSLFFLKITACDNILCCGVFFSTIFLFKFPLAILYLLWEFPTLKILFIFLFTLLLLSTLLSICMRSVEVVETTQWFSFCCLLCWKFNKLAFGEDEERNCAHKARFAPAIDEASIMQYKETSYNEICAAWQYYWAVLFRMQVVVFLRSDNNSSNF